MADSGIMKEAFEITRVNKSQATHFALCKGNNIRYLIDLNGGKERLAYNISTYSGKLELLMNILKIFPFSVLKVGRFGYYVKVELEYSIEKIRKQTETKFWNTIVGTYDEKQKIVLQCFDSSGDAYFIKIGNRSSDKEMRAEIRFLAENRNYQTFDIPIMRDYRLLGNESKFNIQVTKEFHGEKVKPEITQEIIEIYKEISAEKECGKTFSHGDFAPWNIKKSKDKYIVFDWEHNSFRIEGFDIMHYAIIIEMVLYGKDISSAFDSGLANIRNYIREFRIDKTEFLKEFLKMRTQII